jgi:signal transduction histidine kinase
MEGRRLEGLALAGLVHDLNNVLETIGEAAELIAGDPKWADVAAAVTRSVDRGRRLVGSLAGQAKPGCDLGVVAGRAAGFLHDLVRLLAMPAAQVVLDVPEGVRIRGLSSDWERVFMNLFLNAAQAMKEPGEIRVEAALSNEGAVIRVLDDGCGIPQEHLDSIFRPHFSTRGAGGGLGLHIVASLVEEYGGRVEAKNRGDARGACFQIIAPLVDG